MGSSRTPGRDRRRSADAQGNRKEIARAARSDRSAGHQGRNGDCRISKEGERSSRSPSPKPTSRTACRRSAARARPCSGAKYSSIALPDISRVPVNASSASGHGFDAPIASIGLSRCADFLVAVEGAAVQRALPAGLVAGRLVELELQHAREEVARVGRVAGNVDTWRPDRSRVSRPRRPAARCPDTAGAASTQAWL